MTEEVKPDICVIGGGPAGLALALAAADNAVPVVLVERDVLGGTNLTRGTIPSKALIAAADLFGTLRRGPAMGFTAEGLTVDFGALRHHIGEVSQALAPHYSAGRLAALGIRVIAAEARFLDRRTVAAGDIMVRARRFVVATGALPVPPPVRGIESVPYRSVGAAFDIGSERPAQLLVLGAGGRGLEFAQACSRLGIPTTVLDQNRALADEDPELAAIVLDRLAATGLRIRDRLEMTGVERHGGGIRFSLARGSFIEGSHLVVAGGRRPNVASLDLDAANVAHDSQGIVVDRRLRTTNRRIYAIGDVVAGPGLAARGPYHAGRILRAILYRLPFREHAATRVPSVTFTDPELASVGLDEAEARRLHSHIRILRFPFVENDRAQTERVAYGAIKVITLRGGRILGAAIAGPGAGEMIALWSLALSQRLDIGAMARFIPPYPSRAEISQRVAETFAAPGLTPRRRRRIIEFLRKFG